MSIGKTTGSSTSGFSPVSETMETRKIARARVAPPAAMRDTAYKVVTVGELDRAIFDELQRTGAARPADDGGYTITDTAAARSQTVLPKVLDRHGKGGWLLCAVNKMECYIFRRLPDGERVEYKVVTPGEMDRMSLQSLEASGVATFAGMDGGKPVMQILDPARARIQEVLPAVMHGLSADGWQLAAINGPQLYIFARNSR
jgi:hypothetical protein